MAVIYNPSGIDEESVTEKKSKARLFITNSNNEILVVKVGGIYLLPGGKVENPLSALKREIKEEIGIDIDVSKVSPMEKVIYYQKDYPKVEGGIINRKVTTDYFETKMDIDISCVDNNLTELEKKSNFTLEWIKKEELEDVIVNNDTDNPRKQFFNEELLHVLNIYEPNLGKRFECVKSNDDISYVDMHTHTIYSDGDLEPNELIKKAIDNNVGIISITDHDTILAYRNLLYDKEHPEISLIKVIPGVELTVKTDKGRLEILGYNFDLNNKELNERLNELKNVRVYRIIQLLNQIRLDYGIVFDKEDIANIFNKKGNVGRPDIAKLCVKYGYASSNQDAFNKYLIDAYQKTRLNDDMLSYEECIKLIKDAGGISVLAHPKELLLEDYELEELLKKLISCGLDGIEVYHSSNTKEDEEKYLALAEKYNLLVSAGSDYHGESVKPNIELGSCKVKKLSILDKIT